ncbi:uncharacterized protein LOC122510164 [Leptopilina heterotoma]|uniref:uncharacterized protein LOC122510164 n=1 Tax=Leptopilina heterotoma TaxID=63436 RepID=UPI001CA87A26|nr:uncharacterized protein LOC122510164 [Leptopilina heterotoma]
MSPPARLRLLPVIIVSSTTRPGTQGVVLARAEEQRTVVEEVENEEENGEEKRKSSKRIRGGKTATPIKETMQKKIAEYEEYCSEDSWTNPVLEQLDWTASRVLVVRPGVVRATTGAGVGLPLLLFVVILFSSQTQAAVTLLNVASIPTLSPLITRRYLTATTTTTTTTTTTSSTATKNDIHWKTRDAIKNSLSSSPSSNVLQKPNDSNWKRGEGGPSENLNWLDTRNIEFFPQLKVEENSSALGKFSTERIEQATTVRIGDSEVIKGTEFVEEERRTGKGLVQVQVKNVSGEITTSLDVLIGDSSSSSSSSGVEWTTASTVAVPMSSLSYPREELGAGRVRIYLGPKQKRPEEKAGDNKVTTEDKEEAESSFIVTTTQTATTELSPPTRDTSMEALNVSGYIVVVLVLVVGALVGVLATVSHHLHHRPASISILHHHHHHHHREETLTSNQRRLLLEDHYRHPATPVSTLNPLNH